MRTTLAACAIQLILCCIPLCAEEVQFQGGWLDCTWSQDAQYLEIRAGIDEPLSPSEAHMWVLTVYGHRFEDGIFAWQLHYSEDLDSVLVLPNDFLTARHFTTAQLGIGIESQELSSELTVRIPSQGPLPMLAAPGDLIEMHALWIQQPPLVSMLIPVLDNLASQQAGGGATTPGREAQAMSTSPLPTRHRYEQGELISHQFIIEKTPDSDETQRIVLSYSLLRVHHDGPDEFARFSHIPFDFETETYLYEIDTTGLPPGTYRLLIGSANTALTFRMDLEIE